MGQQTDTDDEVTQSQGYHTDIQTDRLTSDEAMRQQTHADDEITQSQGDQSQVDRSLRIVTR